MPLDLLHVPHFARASEYSGVWAIEPGVAAAMWDRARRTDLVAHVANAEPPKLRSDLQTVVAPSGQRVAVVMVTGVLMKAMSSMDSGSSTVALRREIRKAAADPEVAAIMLAIDSPGGTVSGTADLAAEVLAAKKQKPVWAYIEDLGASAAYWVASQADQVFANDATALVGSIGTLAVVYDLSGAAEAEGVKTLVFGTGPLKGAGVPGAPVTDEQQSYFRGLVDDSQKSFDAAVRKGRGLSEKALAEVRTGGVFGASEALRFKLIDGIQSFDATVAGLAAESRRTAKSNSNRASSPSPVRSTAVEPLTVETPAPTASVPVADPVAAQNAALAANIDRVAGINRVAGSNFPLAAQAIRENWSVEKTELAALRASLSSAPQAGNPHAGPHVNTGKGRWQMGAEAAPGVPVSLAVEAALMKQMGRSIEKQYSPAVCQAADESFRHCGLQGAIMLAAVQNGYAGRPGERITQANLKPVLRAAKGMDGTPGLRAESSTIAMSGILGAVANKELVAGYMEEDTAWQEIAAIKSVSNFQSVTTYRMLDDMEYEEIAPDGKIKHGTAGQESYTRQVKTYGKMFAINRTNIINDDLGAFDDIRTRIGRGSAKKMNKVFWTAFMSNLSTTFTSARTNYISGATTNLAVDGVGLSLGVLNFRKMTSPGGTAPASADGSKRVNASTQNPVGSAPGGRPEILLVPPELEGASEVLYRNQNLGGVSNATANIYANKYRPVVAWQLSNSGYTGYSTTMWFLLNNPSYLAAMVVSFLNGQSMPTVEEQEGDFDELCYAYRAYHDFGCDVAEYLAGTMSKGAA